MLENIALILLINNFAIYNFHCTVVNVIHQLHSQHLIFCFELFCHILFCSHFLNQPTKHIFGLFVDVSKITVQFATCEQRNINHPFMFL